MQIVIDIPESILNTIQADEMISREQLAVLQMHILKGTPLPKGHGRIADMDAVIRCIEEVEGPDDAIWTIGLLIEWACRKRTIIEADKAESEE